MLFSHFPQTFVCSCFIILHVHVPGVGELDELLSLYSLNLRQLDLLAFLHPTNLSHQLDLGQLFELQPSLLGFDVTLLSFELLVIVIEHPEEGRHLKIGQAIDPSLRQHFSILLQERHLVTLSSLNQEHHR